MMLQWLFQLFGVPRQKTEPSPPRRPRPSYACTDHVEDDPPPYCHRCPGRWNGTANKPTIFRPDPNRYDKRLCLDWICEECDKREIERLELERRKHNNTREAAELVFTQEGDIFKYHGQQPVEADFPLSYDSLAPYVIRILDAAFVWEYHGLDFDAVVIRDGKVYTRDERGEWPSGD